MATSAYPLCIIDGLVMVPLKQDGNLVDVLTTGLMRTCEESKSNGSVVAL